MRGEKFLKGVEMAIREFFALLFEEVKKLQATRVLSWKNLLVTKIISMCMQRTVPDLTVCMRISDGRS